MKLFKNVMILIIITGILGNTHIQTGPTKGVVATAVGATAAFAGSLVLAIANTKEAHEGIIPSFMSTCMANQSLALAVCVGGGLLAVTGSINALLSSPKIVPKIRTFCALPVACVAGGFGSLAVVLAVMNAAHNASLSAREADYAWATIQGSKYSADEVKGATDGVDLMSNLNSLTSLGSAILGLVSLVTLRISCMIAS